MHIRAQTLKLGFEHSLFTLKFARSSTSCLIAAQNPMAQRRCGWPVDPIGLGWQTQAAGTADIDVPQRRNRNA
jgi:hypothetical protein